MPPLLSPKVVCVARLLDSKCAAAGADWAAIVFVTTKVGKGSCEGGSL